jgi:hypothetical protein
MAGTAAGQRGASGPIWTWHGWLVRDLTADAGACVCSEAQARERWRACVGVRRSRWADAERLGGAAGVAGVGERPCVRAQERVGAGVRPEARSTGQKDTTEGGASARLGGTPASSARVRIQKEKRSGFLPFLANVCTGARACR